MEVQHTDITAHHPVAPFSRLLPGQRSQMQVEWPSGLDEHLKEVSYMSWCDSTMHLPDDLLDAVLNSLEVGEALGLKLLQHLHVLIPPGKQSWPRVIFI